MKYGAELIAELEADIKRTKEAQARRDEHLANCDFDLDDCFVSVRLDENSIRTAQDKIDLLRRGGCEWFTEYANLDGELVDANWCNTKYGWKLRVKYPNGDVKWTTADTKKGLAKLGLKKVMCLRPAWFTFRSAGSGLFGACMGSYVKFPSDINYATGEQAGDDPLEIKDYYEEDE